MKELEGELDMCRRDVEKQRELVIHREALIGRQQRAEGATARSKGKARAVEDTDEEKKRYIQAVQEKKGSQLYAIYPPFFCTKQTLTALESLITTLRSHMSRLTSELALHKTLLDELRSLREADKHTLRQKVREVDHLRREVEKIAGEVEVLKGVVEEGLRERRERNLSHTYDEPQPHDLDDGEDKGESEVEKDHKDESLNAQQDADDYEIEDVQPALARHALLERKTRVGHTTAGPFPITSKGGNRRRYVEDTEVERISVELEERRSERSRSSSRLGSSFSSNGSYRAPSVASSIGSARNSSIAASLLERAATPDSIHQPRQKASGLPMPPIMQDSRPPASTPAHAARERHAGGEETPFPQIRGARLERMFFSAPEHNARTCTVCHRRRHHEAAPRPLWYPASKGRNVTVADANEEDEGFEEGSVVENGEGGNPLQGTAVNLDFLSKDARNHELPPQTVLVRVLRELEDDFTHYKGYVLVPLFFFFQSLGAVLNALCILAFISSWPTSTK